MGEGQRAGGSHLAHRAGGLYSRAGGVLQGETQRKEAAVASSHVEWDDHFHQQTGMCWEGESERSRVRISIGEAVVFGEVRMGRVGVCVL